MASGQQPTEKQNKQSALESLSVSIVDFKDASCHESYSHNEINFVNNLRKPESGSFCIWVCGESPALADTLAAASWDPKQKTQLSQAQTPDVWNREIINMYDFRLLNLW